MPKYVASTTLKELEWNNSHLLEGNVPQAVRTLKEQPGRDLLVIGSNTLVDTLMQDGIVDEYQLMFHPIILGHGMRLFKDESNTHVLWLVDTKAYPTGVLLLTYRPDAGNAQ